MEEDGAEKGSKPGLYFYQEKYNSQNTQPLIEWSPDGKLLGTYLEGYTGSPMCDACIWDVENGKQIKSLNNDEFFVWNDDGSFSVIKANPGLDAYSPNRHYAYDSSDKCIWNVLANKQVCKLENMGSSVYDLSFSGDSSKLFYLDDKKRINIVDMETGTLVNYINLERNLVQQNMWSISPDNNYMALYYVTDINEYKADLRVISLETGKTLASFDGVYMFSKNVWSSDEKFFCFENQHDAEWVLVSLEDLKTKTFKIPCTAMYHIHLACFSPENKYLIYGEGSTEEMPDYNFYDIEHNIEIRLRQYDDERCQEISEPVGRVVFSPDHRKMAGAYWGSGIIFVSDYVPDDSLGLPVSNIRCFGPDFYSLKNDASNAYHGRPIMFSDDEYYVALDGGKIEYLDTKTGEIIYPMNDSASFKKWNITDIKEHWRITDNDIDEKTPYDSGWSPDGKYFYYTTADRLKVCDVEKKLVLHDVSLEPYWWSRGYIHWSTNDWLYIGEEIKGSYPHPDVFLNISSGRLLTLNETYFWRYYDRNNTRFLAFDDEKKKEIRFYDLTTGQKIDFSPFDDNFTCGDGYFAYVHFSPNGRYVEVENSDNTAFKIFEMDSLKEVFSYTVQDLDSAKHFYGFNLEWNANDDFFYFSAPVSGSWLDGHFLFDMEEKEIIEIPSKPVFSPNGYYIAYENEEKDVTVVELKSRWTRTIKFNGLVWSSDSKYIYAYDSYPCGFKSSYNLKKSVEKWYCGDYEFKNHDELEIIEQTIRPLLEKSGYTMKFASSTGIGVATNDSGTTMQLFDLKNGTLLCTTVTCPGGEYLTYTPEGFFTGTDWACHNLVYIVDGLEVTELTQLYDKLYRPDLVAAKMRGEDISEEAAKVAFDSLLSTGTPPKLTLLDVPPKSKTGDLTFSFNIKDCGGGIGTVYASVNGQVKKVSNGIVSRPGDVKRMSYTLPLKNGENTIEVYAYNSAGVIESLRAETVVSWDEVLDVQRPNLYVLAVGINNYGNGSDLRYAVNDAQSVCEMFNRQKSGLYENVYVSLLLNEKGSKRGIADEFQKMSRKITADDVFVFYVSGHGTLCDGDYYYITADFANSFDLEDYGLSKKDMTEYFTPIKARKNLVILDSCHSGASINSGARGINEAVAIKRLVHATGQATLASSADEQVSWEGYDGHGIFTYALLEGLSGKGDMDGDGYVSVTELAIYVEREVPIIAEEKMANSHQQNPKKELVNQDFPLAGVE